MTTMTTTAPVSTEFKLVKTELFDPNVMDALLIQTDKFSKRDLGNLSRYKKNRRQGNEVEVAYEFARNCVESQLGRLYVRGGLGLQAFAFDMRNPLLEKNYWDCDIENAHYHFLAKLADDWGMKTERICHYINNRDAELAKVSANRSVAKTAFLKVAYGGSIKVCDETFNDDGIEPEGDLTLLHAIKKEMDAIVAMCWIKHPQHHRLVCRKEHPKFSLFALILQTEERKCLMAMDAYLAGVDRSMDVLIHDGGCVRKLEDEEEFPEEHLRGMEDAVKDKTGYAVRIVVKPFKHGFVMPAPSALTPAVPAVEVENPEYVKMKEEFETECVKIINPPCFLALTSMSLLDATALAHIYGNKFFRDNEGNKRLFISKWKTDPSIKTYDRLEFLPGKETPPEVLNIWRGFACEQEEGDVSVIRDVLGLVCGRNPEHMEYVENWVAHLFQRPYEKPRVCLVVHSEEEGVGKDTFFDFIGGMLGNQFYNTSSPEHTLFGRFNGGFKEVLMVKIEEGNFETNKANQDNLKGIITAPRLSYEEKGKPALSLNSFLRLVMTTNNPVPLVMSDTQRRFMMLKASPERRGDTDYWKETYATLRKPETARAYFHYLMSKDISQFDPSVFPHSDYKDEIVTATRPYLAKFFQRLCEDAPPEQEAMEWSARELYQEVGRLNNKFELTETKFGRDVKRFAPALQKRKGRAFNSYHFEVREMEAFLKEKHWWVDL
jgi:Family of unknown function (DUF5906)